MATEKKVSWAFPYKSFMFLKLESMIVIVLAVLVFFASFLSFDQQWFKALIFMVIFLGLYTLLSYLIQKFRQVHEHYELSSTHLTMVKKTRKKVRKNVIPLKDIKHHKLDKFVLGGYVLTHLGKKFILFFNNENELEKFRKQLTQHLKPTKAVIVKKAVKKTTVRKTTKKKVAKKKTIKKKVVKRSAVKKKVIKKKAVKRKKR